MASQKSHPLADMFHYHNYQCYSNIGGRELDEEVEEVEEVQEVEEEEEEEEEEEQEEKE